MTESHAQPGRIPCAEDLDDAAQLRLALLDRDKRLIRLRTELVSAERWIAQLQTQTEELRETVDNAHTQVAHILATVPDLLEPEAAELAERIEEDR